MVNFIIILLQLIMKKNLIKISIVIIIGLGLLFKIYNPKQEIITYNTNIELINDSTYLCGIISNDSIYYLHFNNGLHKTHIDKIVYDDSSHYYKTDSIIIYKIIGKTIIVHRTFYIPKNSLKL